MHQACYMYHLQVHYIESCWKSLGHRKFIVLTSSFLIVDKFAFSKTLQFKRKMSPRFSSFIFSSIRLKTWPRDSIVLSIETLIFFLFCINCAIDTQSLIILTSFLSPFLYSNTIWVIFNFWGILCLIIHLLNEFIILIFKIVAVLCIS